MFAAATPLLALLAACGGGNAPTMAESSNAQIRSMTPGVTPFIELVRLGGSNLSGVTSVRYTVAPRPDATSQAVDVTYSRAALARRGYVPQTDGTFAFPVFGLYAGATNSVAVRLEFEDRSVKLLPLSVTSAAYVDPTGIYGQPAVLVKRNPSSRLGYSYFVIKSDLGTPVVLDTDGQIRWAATGLQTAGAMSFTQGGFIVGDQTSPLVSRLELDGHLTTAPMSDPTFTEFHHNIDPGKSGSLAEFNVDDNGVVNLETTLAEITSAGSTLRKWDFAALIGNYMRAHGDDPSQFVRPGVDWFHMNASHYDARDDSLIVSSRENFVIKVDYETGDIRWILGDPTKYWYTFASLRAKALDLQGDGLYPEGQHSVSVTPDGLLMLFNDGLGSLNQPAGTSPGESRTYSAVSAYSIDEAQMTAREVWDFDYNKSIYSDICSSAYQTRDLSTLITYAAADNRTNARLVGLDPQHGVAFDFQFASPIACYTAWNAMPIPFESLLIY